MFEPAFTHPRLILEHLPVNFWYNESISLWKSKTEKEILSLSRFLSRAQEKGRLSEKPVWVLGKEEEKTIRT